MLWIKTTHVLGKLDSRCISWYKACVELDLEHFHGRHLKDNYKCSEKCISSYSLPPRGFKQGCLYLYLCLQTSSQRRSCMIDHHQHVSLNGNIERNLRFPIFHFKIPET